MTATKPPPTSEPTPHDGAGELCTGPTRIASAGDVSALPADLAATMLPADLIRDDEIIILLLRPSMLYIPLTSLGGIAAAVVVALALAYLARFPWIIWTDSQAFGVGVGLVTLRLAWQSLEWWNRVFVLTDRRIIRRMGVLRVSVFESSLRNIEHTSVFMQLRERIFGLGTIGFATSGSDVFDAFWVMIRKPFTVHRIVTDAIRRYGNHPSR